MHIGTTSKRFCFLGIRKAFNTYGEVVVPTLLEASNRCTPTDAFWEDNARRFPFRRFVGIIPKEGFLEGRPKEESMSEVILNSDNFEDEVLNAKEPVLVDFWATWCGPCKMIGPFIAQLAEKYEGRMKVCKANVDEVPDLAQSYGVSSIPTLLIFKDGEVVAQRIGGANMAVLDAFVMDNLQ